MPHSTAGRQARQIETLRTQFAQADGLPFADLLPADRLRKPCARSRPPGARPSGRRC